MKVQDLIFFIILLTLIFFKRGKYLWHVGMFAFILAAILFMVGNLFTSQRLTWYGAGLIFLTAIRNLLIIIKEKYA